jgi:3-phenylpropionate/trans-cinnamate dioxygenase ferredoxin reductase subunit
MTAARAFVAVGAGLAGAKAVETLRAEGFAGRVVLVSAEAAPPYERPPLSKEYLRGETGREQALVHPEGWYRDHDVDLRLDSAAVRLGPSDREVVLTGGERLPYERLLLATGAEPRRLAVPGSELDGIQYLRTLDDSDALRERLATCRALVVVGAGWIGCEVAASARQRGVDVTVVDPLAVPLERVLGSQLGAIYRDIHTDHGVHMRLRTGIAGFEGADSVERVRTTGGETLEADLVVVGIGVQPRTQLAGAAGLEVHDGIVVDEHLQTRVPTIFAAGDVANARHPLYGEPVRVEHWANALHQGPVAARSMLGLTAVYDRVPYFFSDQYDVGMEYAGRATSWDRIVFRGDPATREFIAFWMEGDRIVAGMNVNVWDVADPIQRLIAERTQIDDRRLADPDVPLDELVPA